MRMNKPLEKYFDHTLLKPEASKADIIKLCEEAKSYGFYAVCVNPCYVEAASEALSGSGVKIASVCGFPLGASSTKAKACEAEEAARQGASEIDMVIALGALKEGRDSFVRRDIEAVREAASKYGASVKVILETCLLSEEEKLRGVRLAHEAGAAFVKTSTGFSSGGASVEDVALMRRAADELAGPGRESMGVKASGGIRSLDAALKMIEAGAERIGASASVEIMREYFKKA